MTALTGRLIINASYRAQTKIVSTILGKLSFDPGQNKMYANNDNDIIISNLMWCKDFSPIYDANLVGSIGNTGIAGNITAATNATPIVITSNSHGRTTGDVVIVDGVVGNNGANGAWTITVVDANTFSLNSSIGTGAYISGGVWYLGVPNATNITMPLVSSANGTITAATNATPIVITSNAHGNTTGDVVAITGVVGNNGANGTWTITVIGADTFSLNGSIGTGAYTSGGKWYGIVNGANVMYRGTIPASAPIVPTGSYIRIVKCSNYNIAWGAAAVPVTIRN